MIFICFHHTPDGHSQDDFVVDLFGLDHGSMPVVAIMAVVGGELEQAPVRVEVDEHARPVVNILQFFGLEAGIHHFDSVEFRSDELYQIILGHEEPPVLTARLAVVDPHADFLLVGDDPEPVHLAIGMF